MDDKQPIIEENDSLEAPATVVEQAPGSNKSGVVPEPNIAGPKETPKPNIPIKGRFMLLLRHFNIYIILLVVLVVTLIGFTILSIRRNAQNEPKVSTATESLSDESLAQIEGSDVKVGDPTQTLSIESNTIFAGKVLVRDSVDIAGSLKVGGSLSLAGVDVSGNSLFDQAQLESLTVTGEATIQGAVSLQNNLKVSGSASFGGNVSAPQVTVDTLELNKDLKINRHIVTSGGTPSRSNGASIGAGGTSSISGSDTSGTITINTGSGAPAGCLVSVTFSQSFASTPRVIITPSSSSAAGLDYYTTRSTTGFSVCTASDPPDGTSGITFDYFVAG